MNIIRYIVVLCTSAVLVMAGAEDAYAWAGLGHRTVTELAQRYLTPKTRKAVEAYLDGQTIVDCSEWMDKVRRTEEFSYTANWHVNHFDADGHAIIAEKHGKYNGDALYGLQFIMPVVRNYKEHDDSTVAVNLKFVIHLIADMHCPSHHSFAGIKHVSTVDFYGKETSFHGLWDGYLIAGAHDFSPSEYADYIDSLYRKERKKVCRGTLLEWAESSAADCRHIYDGVQTGSVLGDGYVNAHLGLADRQLAIAGYRLAFVLNQIFDR